jgi:hypothetical protein
VRPYALGSSHAPPALGPRRREPKAVDVGSAIVHTGSAFLSRQLGAALTRYAAERLVICTVAHFLTTTPKHS